jgi:hypothetical protein
LIVAIPLATILAMSLAPLLLSDRIHRIRATATAVALCVLSHYLCFFITFEYHYVTLLPLLPLLVWLRRGEAVRWLRGLLTAALLATAMVLLPTLRFLSADPEAYWLPNALLHVVPVAVAFVLLAIYGIASTQLRAHGTLLECGKRIIASLQASERSMAAIGILLAAVFTAAFATVPERLLTTPSQWKQADWNAHFEDIVSRPGVKPRVEGIMHYTLAMAYAAKKPELAMRHYAAAYRLTQDRDLLTLEMAESFRDGRRNDLAAKLLATLSADKMRDPKLRQKFAELRPTAGMTDSKKQTNH